jgi:hypothetical protein
MYYHPMTWTAFLDRDRSGPWEEVFEVLADGFVGQLRLQLETTREIFLAPLRHPRALADAQDAAAFAARCLAVPFRGYAKLVELSQRASELAAQTGREFQEVLRRHASDGTAWAAAGADGDGYANPAARASPPRSDAKVEIRATPGDRQMPHSGLAN